MVEIKSRFSTPCLQKFFIESARETRFVEVRLKSLLICFLTTLRNCTPHFEISFLSLFCPSRNYLLCASRQCPLLLFPSRMGSVPKNFARIEKIIVLNKGRALFLEEWISNFAGNNKLSHTFKGRFQDVQKKFFLLFEKFRSLLKLGRKFLCRKRMIHSAFWLFEKYPSFL